MKFANKLMVVPFVPRLENATESQIFSIDHDMKKILLDDKVNNNDEKVKLFYNALSKYRDTLDRYQLSKDMLKSSYADSFSTQVASKMMEQIEENFVFPKKSKKEKTEPTENTDTVVKDEPIAEPKGQPALKEEKEETSFEESFSGLTGLNFVGDEDEEEQKLQDANIVDNKDDDDDDEAHFEGVSTTVSTEKQGEQTRYEFKTTKRWSENMDKFIPKIFTSETSKSNDKDYIIYKGMNDNFKTKLELKFKDGIDVEKTINYMKESGFNSFENELAKVKTYTIKKANGKLVRTKKKESDIKREITKETNKFLLLNSIDKSTGRFIRNINLDKTSKVIQKKGNQANLADRRNEDILLNEGKLPMQLDYQVDNQKASGLIKNWIFRKYF